MVQKSLRAWTAPLPVVAEVQEIDAQPLEVRMRPDEVHFGLACEWQTSEMAECEVGVEAAKTAVPARSHMLWAGERQLLKYAISKRML